VRATRGGRKGRVWWWERRRAGLGRTHSVQMQVHEARGLERCRLAPQRDDLADDADGLRRELLEVCGVYAGGGFVGHGGSGVDRDEDAVGYATRL
jgi:hypothetical protein